MKEMQAEVSEREDWEEGEEANNHKASHPSQSLPNSEGAGKKGTIKNPNLIDIPSPISLKPVILRPCYMVHLKEVAITAKKIKPGVYWHYVKEGVDIDDWICDPLIVKAITSSTNDDDYGRLLRFKNSNGRYREWAMPMYMLKGRGDELFGELLNQGLELNIRKRSDITNYIMTQKPHERITAATCIGWNDENFVLPNQVIGKGNVVFQSEIASENEFITSGTIDEWKEAIGRFCEGNIPLTLCVSAAIAGPLLKLLSRPNFCLHLVGDSSSGKSTSAEIAASIWGSTNIMRSWRSTGNGLEAIAATRNDTCLVLDEIGEVSPHEIGNISYMLINGQGKQRSGRVGNARKIQRWRLAVISTGEKSLAGIMSEISKEPQTGQVVRLLSIPVSFEHGSFSNLHGFKDGRHLADHLKKARLKYYGHIGPTFVERLMNDKRDLSDLLHEISEKLNENVESSIEGRAADAFAIVGLAGELGIDYGLLPLKSGMALEAAFEGFKRWLEFQGKAHTEDEKILQNIRNFIAKHGDSRFSEFNDVATKTINRAGWYKDVDDDRVYMFTAEALKEASGFDMPRTCRTLDKAGWIVAKDKDKSYTKKTYVQKRSINLYHICEKAD